MNLRICIRMVWQGFGSGEGCRSGCSEKLVELTLYLTETTSDGWRISWKNLQIHGERSPLRSSFAGKICDSTRVSFFLKDCTPWKRPMLEQFIKNCQWEGLMLEQLMEDCLPWEGPHVETGEGLLSLTGKQQQKQHKIDWPLFLVSLYHSREKDVQNWE